MTRSRYWKLTPDEVEKFTYDSDKVLNWDVKCIREPEEEAKFIGVFLYRFGTPMNYETVKGISFFHNHIPLDELPEIVKFLKGKYGGEQMEKGERFFLKDSKEFYSGKEIADLAKQMEEKFNTKAIITIEFRDLSEEEADEAGLPSAKLLPIATSK